MPQGVTNVQKYTRFFLNLSQFLNLHNFRTLANYLIWNVVKDSLSYLGKSSNKLINDFLRETTGRMEEPPRWEQCITHLSESNTVLIGLSAQYVQRYVDGESKQKVRQLIKFLELIIII